MRKIILLLAFCALSLVGMAQSGVLFGSDQLSSTMITAICQDRNGFIWIGTENGLNRFDGHHFTKYFHQSGDTTSLSYNVVSTLFCDRKGQLWVGTTRSLQRYDDATDAFVNYPFPSNLHPRVSRMAQTDKGQLLVGTSGYGLYAVEEGAKALSPQLQNYGYGDFFGCVYVDLKQRFWMSDNGKVSCRYPDSTLRIYDATFGNASAFFEWGGKTLALCRDNIMIYDEGKATPAPFDYASGHAPQAMRSVCHDGKGNVYFGTVADGVYWMPAGSNRVERFRVNVSAFDMNAAKVFVLFQDKDGNLWMGCQHKGLLLIPNRKEPFASWTFADQKTSIGTYVSSVINGSDGVTWCVVQNKGVFGFDIKGNIVARPTTPAGAEFIYQDTEGQYWLGTNHGVYTFDPHSGRAELFCNTPCDKFNAMIDNGRGWLFFSTFAQGVQVYNRKTKQWRRLQMVSDPSARDNLCNNWVMSFTAEPNGRVWMATSNAVTCYDPERNTFLPYGWQKLCADRLCNSVCALRGGDMVIGTEKGLFLWHRKTNTTEPFPGSDKLRNVVICRVEQDSAGDLWCSTTNGIWHYQASRRQWVAYVSGSGLKMHEYVNCVGAYQPRADRLFFAHNDGITTFMPSMVARLKVAPGTLTLTSFSIGMQPVNVLTRSNGHRVTKKPVTESDHFTVSYSDNTVALEFSLLNYASPTNVIYEYRLDDADDWTYNVGGQNRILLNHLPIGTHRIEVRALDNGVPSQTRCVTVEVLAPWYLTTWAYLLYMFIALGGMSWAVIAYRRKMGRQLDEEKMKFLINATHDIRSPLTLILSPLDKLRRRNLDDESQADLSVIEHNAERILSLVNQILDVRKIDKQQMHLHCRETDMVDFIDVICKVFEYNAHERGIHFTFEHPDNMDEAGIKAWIDRVQFDKVVTNLLSNAFKFTFDQGDITVRLTTGTDPKETGPLADYVELSVEDNGTGMRDDTIAHLFDRFYQGTSSKSSHIEGTGIGLNLCKMIVDMHHGRISARNRTDGIKGSIFTVRLPKGCAHLSETEIDDHKDKAAVVTLNGKEQPRSSSRVLVVDDDEEISRYIAGELGDYYHFNACFNGKDALKELLSHTTDKDGYDVVVSDVMMPEMDGFTMLRLIKNNAAVSHIPVIMLTSKTDVGNRLEGLEKGADAYLTKPFSMDELHLTIDNLIASHQRIKGRYGVAAKTMEEIEQAHAADTEETLLDRVMKSVSAHLGDSDFNVDQLCDEVAISRAHLHRRMKEMTGLSISEFVRNVRLEQSLRLLKEQRLNITQVAYKVGFSNLGYFSTVFRKHFGMSPREFIDKQQQEGDAPQ